MDQNNGKLNSSAKPRLKIAMFSIHSDPLAPLGSQETGGQNIYVKHLTEQLDKIGYSVDVFTRWDSQHKKQIANIGKRSRIIRLKGGAVSYVPKKDLFNILPEIFDNFLSFINYENPYDIFHGHYWDGGWMALEAHKKFIKPLIENFHSLGKIRMETKLKYQKNGKEDEYFNKRFELEKEIVKNSSVIISLSETEKTNLKDLYECPPEKVRVIPGGINLKNWPHIGKKESRNYLVLSEKDFIILFVGRLEWRKGAGTLISAANLLKKDISNLKVIIVGGQIFGKIKNSADLKEYARLLEGVRAQGMEDIVSFRGKVNHNDLPSFYQSADIFVVPSYYEPFGLVALEGMANKIPTIVSNVGGLSTIIKDKENGLLFEPRNPVSLKEKILVIYKSKDIAEKMAEKAYQDIRENYSMEKIVKDFDEIYNNLN